MVGWMVLLAGTGMWAVGQGQQSAGSAAGGHHGHKHASDYNQEYGPQRVSRRGDKMTAVTPGGKGGKQESQTINPRAQVRVEKFNAKQADGSQAKSRHGGRAAAGRRGAADRHNASQQVRRRRRQESRKQQ